MLAIYRARQLLVTACIGAIVLVAIEFPLRQLMQQRSQIAAAAQQLAAVEGHNAALNSAIRSLAQPSQIAAIAHQEYGLVKPGQRLYVILPSASSSSTKDPVAPGEIPVDDLGSTAMTSTLPGPASTTATKTASLWRRFIGHLEFWH